MKIQTPKEFGNFYTSLQFPLEKGKVAGKSDWLSGLPVYGLL